MAIIILYKIDKYPNKGNDGVLFMGNDNIRDLCFIHFYLLLLIFYVSILYTIIYKFFFTLLVMQLTYTLSRIRFLNVVHSYIFVLYVTHHVGTLYLTLSVDFTNNVRFID